MAIQCKVFVRELPLSNNVSLVADSHASSGRVTADAMMSSPRHCSIALVNASCQAGLDASIHFERSQSSEIGVIGMAWMPNVYSMFEPNHVLRST